MRVERVLTCECGFDARAADEEGLVAAVRRHAAEAHCMPLSHDEALLLVFHAELAAQPTTRELEPSPNERLVAPLTRSC
jgi:Protein of unknown function (DUF1059)